MNKNEKQPLVLKGSADDVNEPAHVESVLITQANIEG